MGDTAVRSFVRRRVAKGVAAAIVALTGLAAPANAVPAPNEMFALYATSTYFTEWWCPAADRFCTRDTSSQTFATTLNGAYGAQLDVAGRRQGNALGSNFAFTPGHDPNNKTVLGSVWMFTNAMFDSYTLSGPGAGPVPITLNVHLTGEMFYTAFTNTGYADVRARLAVGARNQNYNANLSGDTTVIDPGHMLIFLDRFISTYAPFCKPTGNCAQGPVDMMGTTTFTVTPGTPFEIGYSLMLSGGGVADFGHTASIDFVLPEGYSLSSARGWTDPDLAATGIPAPAGPALFAVGLFTVAALRRCRTA